MAFTLLFSCLFGSRLYGTQTPTSDLDVKHIVLVDIDELLLGRGVKNSFHKTNTQKNTRNTADDVDEEFIPIQVFARHFIEGQTYALEFAFALEGTHAQQTFYTLGVEDQDAYKLDDYDRNVHGDPMFLEFVKELRTKFLTSNIKAMMGYVVNQASLYSFKGERLNAVREMKKLLEEMILGTSETCALADHGQDSRWTDLVVKYPKYFRIDEYDIGGNRLRPCFYLLEKCFPWTNTLEHSLEVAKNLEHKYGTRADQASESNVDWKATMHALRIVNEGLMLLEFHRLSFPFEQPYVDHLLAIKRGELPLEPIKNELAFKLDKLKELEKTTTLPTSKDVQDEFEVWLKGWMRKFYGI